MYGVLLLNRSAECIVFLIQCIHRIGVINRNLFSFADHFPTGCDIGDFPNAYAHFANEITLPLHTRLTDEEVQYVIDNYVDILKEYL